jgi:hypothetical protein
MRIALKIAKRNTMSALRNTKNGFTLLFLDIFGYLVVNEQI